MENGLKKAIQHWVSSALYDLEVARTLFKKAKYPYALFFCHLALEKALKSLVVKSTGRQADPIHNLVMLARKSGLEFNEAQMDFFTAVTRFNIQARYQDYKDNFYKKATKSFTAGYFKRTGEMLEWLIKK